MLTKAMCADWAQFKIQINAVGPGYFITEMTQVLADNPVFDAWVKDRTPSRRWGYPAELAGAAVFFCSEASSSLIDALGVRRQHFDNGRRRFGVSSLVTD
jgi:gluconate 5-dehydrogenase